MKDALLWLYELTDISTASLELAKDRLTGLDWYDHLEKEYKVPVFSYEDSKKKN